ncbi:MAG: hypothetical protein M3O70_13455 [Actinomycetota bacterium]|nr:hypothetical protein [Actinomycetota bacterium]
MRRSWQVLVVAVVAATLLGGGVSPAGAVVGPDSPVSWVVEPVTVTATAPSCWEATRAIAMQNSVRETIARYFHRFNWCTNATHTLITSPRHAAWGECYRPFCSFVGNIDQYERGAGGGFPSYTAYTKGHFCWGAKDVACGVQRYPYHEGMVSAGTRDRVFDTRAGW